MAPNLLTNITIAPTRDVSAGVSALSTWIASGNEWSSVDEDIDAPDGSVASGVSLPPEGPSTAHTGPPLILGFSVLSGGAVRNQIYRAKLRVRAGAGGPGTPQIRVDWLRSDGVVILSIPATPLPEGAGFIELSTALSVVQLFARFFQDSTLVVTPTYPNAASQITVAIDTINVDAEHIAAGVMGFEDIGLVTGLDPARGEGWHHDQATGNIYPDSQIVVPEWPHPQAGRHIAVKHLDQPGYGDIPDIRTPEPDIDTEDV